MPRGRFTVIVGIAAAFLATGLSACSDNGEGECDNDSSCAFFIPAEVWAEIPEESFISTSTTADFNGDREDDYVVAYGSIVGTSLEVITFVDGKIETFTDPVGILFEVANNGGDPSDDLNLWFGNPATWHNMIWRDGRWADAAVFDPNDHGPG